MTRRTFGIGAGRLAHRLAYRLAPAQEFEAEWGPSDTFVNAAFKSLWGHYAPDA